MSPGPAADPCTCIASLDLGREADCVRILERDKHGRLEGLCAELLFLEELVRPCFSEISLGWWVAKAGEQPYRVAQVVEVGYRPTAIDDDVCRLFLDKGLSVHRLEFDAISRRLMRYRIRLANGDPVADSGMIQDPSRRPALIPGTAERDPARTERAIEYLRARGALRECAVSRLIANCFVHSPQLWDVDAIVRHDGRLLAFETKQKYPSRSGRFGINTGLAGMFHRLQECGLRVIHVVLTKPVHDLTTSAIEMIVNPTLRAKSLWIAIEAARIGSSRRLTPAPERTSIDGRRRMVTWDLEITDFSLIGTSGTDCASGLNAYLSGTAPRLAGVGDLPRHRISHIF